MQPNHVHVEPEPRREQRGAFCVAGLAAAFTADGTQGEPIHSLWQRAFPHFGDLDGVVQGAHYGVCLPASDGSAGRFTYVAGMEVAGLDNLPDGFTGVRLDASDYLVFRYHGSMGPEVPAAMEWIFGTWLPEHGVEPVGADFEYYGPDFSPDGGVLEVWVPVG